MTKRKKKPREQEKSGKVEKQHDPFDVEKIPGPQEMERFLADFFKKNRSSGPIGEAQDAMYKAWEEEDPFVRIALALKALKISPDCADAYVLLAEEYAETPEEALDFYLKGVEAGERAIGRENFEEYEGHFWGVLETRPYMRARAGYAKLLWDTERREEAIGHFQELLRLNPNDNQGNRYLLLPWLITLGRDEEAETLYKKYEDDDTAFWSYSRALLDFRRFGDSREASVSLRQAVEGNTHVPNFLLGKKKLPQELPSYYSPGNKDEAVLYILESGEAWVNTEGALSWLQSRTVKPVKKVSKKSKK